MSTLSAARTGPTAQAASAAEALPAAEVVVAVDNVSKTFGRTRALDGLTLRVIRGEKYGLLGPNGSGKTTLIRCMVGLVLPDKGRVTVLGRTVPSAAAAARVGYMTQAPALYEDLTVVENLHFFARLFGAGADAARRIEEVLELVDLGARRRSPVRTLSGGMRQRVSLAAALSTGPSSCSSTNRRSGSTPS